MRLLTTILSAGLAAGLWLPLQAQSQRHTNNVTVTGCLIKGAQPNEYTITANGTTYDLFPAANVDMAAHVGHKVQVSGKYTGAPPSADHTASRTAGERVEVTKLRHISPTCP